MFLLMVHFRGGPVKFLKSSMPDFSPGYFPSLFFLLRERKDAARSISKPFSSLAYTLFLFFPTFASYPVDGC